MPILSPRNDLGDNYYYYIMLNHAADRFSTPDETLIREDHLQNQVKNSISNTYIGALLVGNLVHNISSAMMKSSRDAVLLTLILQTALLVFAFMLLVIELLEFENPPSVFAIFCVAFLSTVFLEPFNISAYLGTIYFNYDRLFYYPNILRVINPTMFWAMGLMAMYFLVRFIRDEKPIHFWGATISSLSLGFFGISMAATMAFAISIYLAILVVKEKKSPRQIVVLTMVMMAAVFYGFYQIYQFMQTPMGAEIQTGSFASLKLRWHFLVFALLIPLSLKLVSGNNKYLTVSLITASMVIGIVCDSFNLGDRLWIRGSSIFIWLFIVLLTWKILLLARNKLQDQNRLTVAMPKLATVVIQILTVAACIYFVYGSQKPDLQKWNGFVERDKWEVLEWFDKHAGKNEVIASANIEDSYLIPIYTKSKPLIGLYGTTDAPTEEVINRYLFVLRMFNLGNKYLERIFDVKESDISENYAYVVYDSSRPFDYEKFQVVAFYTSLIYYPFNFRFSNVLTGQSNHDSFKKFIMALYHGSDSKNYHYDFLIIDKRKPRPGIADSLHYLYENKSYVIARR